MTQATSRCGALILAVFLTGCEPKSAPRNTDQMQKTMAVRDIEALNRQADARLKMIENPPAAPAAPKSKLPNQFFMCMGSESDVAVKVPRGVIFDSWGPIFGTIRDPMTDPNRPADTGPDGPQIVTFENVDLTPEQPCRMVEVRYLIGFNHFPQRGGISARPTLTFSATWSGEEGKGVEAFDVLIDGGQLTGVLASDVTATLVLRGRRGEEPDAELSRLLKLPPASTTLFEEAQHRKALGLPQ